MAKGMWLWIVWLTALAAGVYGTAMVYTGIFNGQPGQLVLGIPTLLLGIWITGNIWASARQAYRKQRAR